MRRFVGLILVFALALACSGCGSTTALAASAAEEKTEEREEQAARTAEPDTDVLVVYFSGTGTTRGIAEKIASLTGADLAEILPARPYTAEDLNYHDRTTRATVEQDSPDVRPEIAQEISLEGYSTVYLGYPIWWGQAPRILSTFVESHDFSGITVIPFCTSGSSDMGQSDDTLAAQAGGGNWLQGRRFSGSAPEDELLAWIEEKEGEMTMEKSLRLFVDGRELAVDWEKNESVAALADLVSPGALDIAMSMYGGFEQVGPIGTSLPRNDSQTTTQAGDIVLYSGNQIVVFYGSNSWAYTRLGRITDQSAADMAALLGAGDVTVTISLG